MALVSQPEGVKTLNHLNLQKIRAVALVTFSVLAIVTAVTLTTMGTGKTAQADEVKTLTMKVDGMSCSGCAGSIQYRLTGMQGVKGCGIDLDHSTVQVTYTRPVTPQAILAAVGNLGYGAREEKVVSSQ